MISIEIHKRINSMKKHSMYLRTPDGNRQPDLTHGYIEMMEFEGWPSPVSVFLHKVGSGWASTEVTTGCLIAALPSGTRAMSSLHAYVRLKDVGYSRALALKS